jgi:bifunctional DNA-binding transcriptional regulator/antitoxin component of YhaV-PrlF toxin-antitoxin module
MNTTARIEEIVQPMQRGQITIPIQIKKKLNFNPDTWLWVRLVKDKILIEPVKEKENTEDLSEFLIKHASDKQVYWTQKDEQALEKVEQKTQKRVEKYTK